MKKSLPLVLVEFIEAFAWINSFHLSIIIVSQELFFTKPTVGHHHHHRRRETEHEIHWTVSPQQRHDRFHYETTCVVTYLKSFFWSSKRKPETIEIFIYSLTHVPRSCSRGWRLDAAVLVEMPPWAFFSHLLQANDYTMVIWKQLSKTTKHVHINLFRVEDNITIDFSRVP